MDTGTSISLVSLLVAILAFPFSYWISKRLIGIELEQYEQRNRKRAQLLVANYLDEFFKIFYAAVREIVHIEQNELQYRIKEIEPHIAKIDIFVEKTKVLERLANAINSLMETGYAGMSKNRLLSIRNQIHLGSDTTRSVTISIISICDGDSLLTDLKESK